MDTQLVDSATADAAGLTLRDGRVLRLVLAVAALLPSGCSSLGQCVAGSTSRPVGAACAVAAATLSSDRPLAEPAPISAAHAVVGPVTEPGGLPDGYAPEGYVSPDWAYSGYVEPEPAAPCDESAPSRCNDAASAVDDP